MKYRFTQHYTRDQARALLPQIREWLQRLQALGATLARHDQRVGQLLKDGDAGGPTVNEWVRTFCSLRQVAREFRQREIQIKDLDRGLIDFPAILGGREVFLCWEMDEDDIEYWHDLDTGYAGRERL